MFKNWISSARSSFSYDNDLFNSLILWGDPFTSSSDYDGHSESNDFFSILLFTGLLLIFGF